MSVKLITGQRNYSLGAPGNIIASSNSQAAIALNDATSNLYLQGGDGVVAFDFAKSFLNLDDAIANVGYDFSGVEYDAFGNRMFVTNVAGVSKQLMIDLKNNVGTFEMSFFGKATVPQPTGVAVTDVAIHAALVALGLITA